MKTSYIELERLVEQRKNNPLYNTSYPLSPADWAGYLVDGELPFDPEQPLAFYLHIPFCKQICSFCEYTRVCLPQESVQNRYVEHLIRDVDDFIGRYPGLMLYGFDIGGGTPTALCDSAFNRLLGGYSDVVTRLKRSQDFEPSIEATFPTLSESKIDAIARAGISRISLGVQSASESVMQPLHRRNDSISSMAEVIARIHLAGIRKVNLDLMYGLPGQTEATINVDLEMIHQLAPEQVTLYELRTNQLTGSFSSDADRNYQQYCLLFKGLTDMGYRAEFGQNTFSLDAADFGVSSYLRHRMLDGWQYKGFGISAQSMSSTGLSYNIGKNDRNILNLIRTANTFESHSHYSLPRQELLAKYIAISGYSGGFSQAAANRIMNGQFIPKFADTLDFLSTAGLIHPSGDRVRFTEKGFKTYGAILSLFYPSGTQSSNASAQ